MKKLFCLIALALGITFIACARDEYSRDINTLPQAARMTLNKNFKAKMSMVKTDKTLGMIKDYEVILTDGTEVEFDSKGNWKSVETPAGKSVPSSLLPASLVNYVAKNYKGDKIVGVDKERNKYEVELGSGIDLEFDLNGNFLRFD